MYEWQPGGKLAMIDNKSKWSTMRQVSVKEEGMWPHLFVNITGASTFVCVCACVCVRVCAGRGNNYGNNTHKEQQYIV